MQEGLPFPVNYYILQHVGKMWKSLSWSLPPQFATQLLHHFHPEIFVELLRAVSAHRLRKHLEQGAVSTSYESSPFRNLMFEHGPPNGSNTFLQGEVTKLWRRCFFPCVPSWKIEPLGPLRNHPKTDNVSCAMWVVKLGWEFGMFWRI